MMLNKMRTSNQKSKFYRVLRILDGVMGALLTMSTIKIFRCVITIENYSRFFRNYAACEIHLHVFVKGITT